MIYCISLLFKSTNNNVYFIAKEYNLKDFSFFKRKHAKEFINFSSRECIKAMDKKDAVYFNHKIDKLNYSVFGYTNNKKLYCSMVVNNKYPLRLCKNIAINLIDDFSKIYSNYCVRKDSLLDDKLIKKYITDYEKPETSDKIEKVKKDLDDVKDIMVENITVLLNRGEKIDDLVEKTNDLSESSKRFYKTTKKMGYCCILV